uniref:DUF7722 domain-containing protein n=1 Tax=Opuntia streptacantha TaxID=393608 RepID=A0A7C8YJ64_OPUST
MVTTTLIHWAFPHLIIPQSNGEGHREMDSLEGKNKKVTRTCDFEMPLHYPRYTKEDYAKMEEWKVDLLLSQYGLHHVIKGTSLDDKRKFAMGAFLWPDQL